MMLYVFILIVFVNGLVIFSVLFFFGGMSLGVGVVMMMGVVVV